ncbi:MOSC domain-containing protein [Mycobacterium sp. IDR2000157661]|uniref:MOSC domain-containing protein n=1 Tax=Mycobacterium sp. IDR2000157661 TaxID=2867005 RepID=UPI001EEDE42E|nr:MOSC domain-containing protein [Mycobacterium sp. IDR2000157661]ULE35176.1 MOSC domain-containing protein [Mycobacterium sp. IDR2000157661]
MTIGQVAELWRFPCKSLGGVKVDQAEIGPRGLRGDRLWAVRDLEREITASARRMPALLTATARYTGPVPPDAGPGNVPEIEVTFPDGTVLSSSDAEIHARLSDLAGRDVRLTALPPAEDTSLHRMRLHSQKDAVSSASVRADFGVDEGEKPPDLAVLPMADLLKLGRYSTPPGMFVDLAPIHVMTTTSLATIGAEVGEDLDVRRFRPNVLVTLDDPDHELPESQWAGAQVTLGGVDLKVISQTVRCVVPSRAQPGLDVDRRVTRAVAARAQRCLGVYCTVGRSGTVRIGDRVAVERIAATRPRRLLDDVTKRAKRMTLGLATAAADRMSR